MEVSNNGVNIGTHKGADVRAVFNGVVVAVASIGGMEGKVVIIKHGEYLSVYSNLESAYVKSGDKIKTKQCGAVSGLPALRVLFKVQFVCDT